MMHPQWQTLLKHAILGTAQQPYAVPTASDDILSPLYQQLTTKPTEEQLLSTAALLLISQQVGALPPKATEPPIPTCEAETRPLCTPKAAHYLEAILLKDINNWELLLLEWVALAQKKACIVPPKYLPTLLNVIQSKPELRGRIPSHVVGKRGEWLCQQSSAWKELLVSVDINEENWTNASQASRVQWLANIRATDPAKARQLLENTWGSESAKDKQAFLPLFFKNLSLDDEPFLNRCLKERSSLVVLMATRLLSCLPSALTQQLLSVLDNYLQIEQKTLRQRKLIVTLPETFNDDWKKWGVPEKDTPYGMGEKMGWLYHLLSLIHPKQFLQRWQIDLDTFLALAKKTAFAGALESALYNSISGHQDAENAVILIKSTHKKIYLDRLHHFATTIDFSDAEREALLMHYFTEKNTEAFNDYSILNPMNALIKGQYSPEMSRYILKQLPTWLKAEPYYQITYFLQALACKLAPETYADISPELRQSLTEKQSITGVELFLKYYEYRFHNLQEFKS
ncbi:hypothetical protein BegalDRAFT_1526 [Beggiatoa alba B18LD]|uniref:Uncharacterized protein n=1 Tax=Beggiatoa alba B18LD TaxID=395493 RepID=I3CFL5_9GAMM|nr:DUF5691 domain-containing protein [Beggiatoa alba]EIJ42408.1 hypothetical protein BegalDRAFT_1526 [Beggiatoa alba B18LD]